MKKMRKIFPLITLVLMLFSLAACGSSAKPTTTAAIPPVPQEYAGKTNPFGAEAAAEGAKTFGDYCVPCHGEDARGDGPAAASIDPPPANLVALLTQVGDDFLFWRISTGVPGTSMVSWSGVLSDDQIWQVIAYLRTLK